MIRIKESRYILTPKCTVSDLTINNGISTWKILEDTTRDLNENGKFDNGEVKVYGQTSIPYGNWRCEFKHSNHFNRIMLYINANEFSGTMLHWGTKVDDTLGCPLIGSQVVDMKNGLYELRDSHIAYRSFLTLLCQIGNYKLEWQNKEDLLYTITVLPESDKEIYFEVVNATRNVSV